MRAKTSYFVIGLFVVVGTIVILVATMLLGTGVGSRSITLETYVTESVQGLDAGAPVTFRGVRIGEVEEIAIASVLYESTQLPYVVIRCAVRPQNVDADIERLTREILRMLASGLYIRLATRGLTGALYIEADVVADGEDRVEPLEYDWVPEYPYVPAAPSRIRELGDSLDDVLTNLGKADVASLVDDLREFVRSGTDAIQEADLPVVARRAADAFDAAEGTLQQMRSDIAGVAAEAEDFLRRARSLVDEVDAAVDPDQLRTILADVHATTSRLRPAAEQLEQTLALVHDTGVDLRGMLRSKSREVDLILDGVREISRNLATLTATLEHYPSLLLLGNPPPPVELGDRR